MDSTANSTQGGHQSDGALDMKLRMPFVPLPQVEGSRPSPATVVEKVSSDSPQHQDRCDSGAPDGDSSNPRGHKRGHSNEEVKRACHECQQRKSKCSGSRPVCQFCSERNLGCTWNGPPGQKAMLQVRSACLRCHKRKAKCSGERPACRFCRDRNLECKWDVADGATRMADLKRRIQEAAERTQDPDTLLEAMRTGSDEESTMLLAKLRTGHSVKNLVRSIQDDSSPSQSQGETFGSRQHS